MVSGQLLYKHILSNVTHPGSASYMLNELIRVTKPGGKIKDFPVPKTPHPAEESILRHIETMIARAKARKAGKLTAELTESDQDDIRKFNLYGAVMLAFKDGLVGPPLIKKVIMPDQEEIEYMLQLTKRENRQIGVS